jgi:hypothetical protein
MNPESTPDRVKYRVETDSRSGPWVCRYRFRSRSPGGKKERWESLDGADSWTISTGPGGSPGLSDDAEGAITHYQVSRVMGMTFDVDEAARYVREILAAERIRSQ